MIIILKIAAALNSCASRPRSASDWNEHATKSTTAVITATSQNAVSSCDEHDDDDGARDYCYHSDYSGIQI